MTTLLPALPPRCAFVCEHGCKQGTACGRGGVLVPVEVARAPDGECGPEAKFIQFKGEPVAPVLGAWVANSTRHTMHGGRA